ncbi:MAG: hypothetical protein ABIO44_06250 [Saprospiraceae bacterium]
MTLFSTNSICVINSLPSGFDQVFVRMSVKLSQNGPIIATVYKRIIYPCQITYPNKDPRSNSTSGKDNEYSIYPNILRQGQTIKLQTKTVKLAE